MNRQSGGIGVTILLILSIGIAAALVFTILRWKSEDTKGGGIEEIIHELTASEVELHHKDQEHHWWVGDVAGLHSQGGLPREIAEADLNPITPLVERPRPYRDYFVVAMNSAPSPSLTQKVPMLLKGQTRNKEMYAFCIVPAAEHSGLPVYIVSPIGVYRKLNAGKTPVLDWPKDWGKEGWGIVD